jgi:hypothetical protein
MDAATLVMTVLLADGQVQTRERYFPTVDACERFVAFGLERKPAALTVLSYVCRPNPVGLGALAPTKR